MRVSNALGSVTSSPAVVTIAVAPVITDQPDSASIAPGQTVTLSVAATGQSLSYQWEREVQVNGGTAFQPIAAATSTTYTTGTAGRYRVQVSNPAGTVTSAIATLTAQPPQQACPAPTGAGTTHTAGITQPQVWTAAASPHVVVTGFTIRAAVTLEPCAVVRLGPDVTLTVNAGGSIVANGSAERPVVIERQDSARPWSRIQALGGGTLRLTHTRLLGGGAPLNAPLDAAAAIEVRGADQTQPPGEQLHVDNVLIEGSASQGVLLREAGGFSLASTGLVIRGSAHAPIDAWASAAGTIPSGTYTGNARDEIILEGTGLGAIVRDATLRDRGVAYRVGDSLTDGRLDVAARPPLTLATLTIEPNVTLRFKRGGAVFVQVAQNNLPATGALVAQGTLQGPIRFTSAESAPAAGDWLGVHFNGRVNPSTRLDHVQVEYAGGQTSFVGSSCRYPDNINNAAAIRVFVEPGSAFVTNTTVVASARHGIDRGWSGPSSVSFLGSNDLSGAASCRETFPTPNGAPCPSPPPCP